MPVSEVDRNNRQPGLKESVKLSLFNSSSRNKHVLTPYKEEREIVLRERFLIDRCRT